MTEAEKRKYRVCFTGHRPEKLKKSELEIKRELEIQIRRSMAEGKQVFITGMARGVDIWAAEIILRLKDEKHPIKLICAIPYKGFEDNWELGWRVKYQMIQKSADHVIYVSDRYSPACFQIRNEWMVNHSSEVIAVFNEGKGGTKNTIDYAIKKGVPLFVIKD